MSAAERPPLDGDAQPPSYHDTLLAVLDMLQRGPVMLTVDAREEDVTVPDHVRGPALALLIAYNRNLKKPLVDLEVDARGVRCVMSFANTPHWVDLPWRRIWRATSKQRAVLWGERVPEGLVDVPTPRSPAPPAPTPAPRGRHLRLVTDADDPPR